MKTEVVKAHEKVDGKLVFVGQGELTIAESLEDIILMTEDKESGVDEATVVQHFNASRRIEFQRQLKAGNKDGKPSPKAVVAKLQVAAKGNEELAKLLRDAGFSI